MSTCQIRHWLDKHAKFGDVFQPSRRPRRSSRWVNTSIHLHIWLHKPIAYIIGTQPFCGWSFLTKPPVLIPRWETEEWLNTISNGILSSISSSTPLRVVDLCTGSGCIGLSFLGKYISRFQSFKDISAYLVDIDPRAVILARKNLQHLQLQLKISANSLDSVVRVIQTDVLSYDNLSRIDKYTLHDSNCRINPSIFITTNSPSASENELPFYRNSSNNELISSNDINNINADPIEIWLSNPPYILPKDLTSLPLSVRNWESAIAVDGLSSDGIRFHKAIISYLYKKYSSFHTKKWILALEIDGEHQCAPLTIFIKSTFNSSVLFSFLSDSSGIKRVLIMESKIGVPFILNPNKDTL